MKDTENNVNIETFKCIMTSEAIKPWPRLSMKYAELIYVMMMRMRMMRMMNIALYKTTSSIRKDRVVS
jgi:hypothetical protein